jgi:hypothetical protein
VLVQLLSGAEWLDIVTCAAHGPLRGRGPAGFAAHRVADPSLLLLMLLLMLLLPLMLLLLPMVVLWVESPSAPTPSSTPSALPNEAAEAGNMAATVTLMLFEGAIASISNHCLPAGPPAAGTTCPAAMGASAVAPTSTRCLHTATKSPTHPRPHLLNRPSS